MWKSDGKRAFGKIIPHPMENFDSDYVDLETHPDFKMIFGDKE